MNAWRGTATGLGLVVGVAVLTAIAGRGIGSILIGLVAASLAFAATSLALGRLGDAVERRRGAIAPGGRGDGSVPCRPCEDVGT